MAGFVGKHFYFVFATVHVEKNCQPICYFCGKHLKGGFHTLQMDVWVTNKNKIVIYKLMHPDVQFKGQGACN